MWVRLQILLSSVFFFMCVCVCTLLFFFYLFPCFLVASDDSIDFRFLLLLSLFFFLNRFLSVWPLLLLCSSHCANCLNSLSLFFFTSSSLSMFVFFSPVNK